MQVTFNVPAALQRDLEWLAAKQGSSVDALLYITAFQGFEKELKRKAAEEKQREEAGRPYRERPAPIDWAGSRSSAPIKWPKREKVVQR